MSHATTQRRRSLPTKIIVTPSPVRRIVTFDCPGCDKRHRHRYTGPGYYLPQCPAGTGYWKTNGGYWLKQEAE